MSERNTSMLIAAALLLLTALGNAWALFLVALAGLTCLVLVYKQRNRRRLKNLIAAFVAFFCALAIVDVAGYT